MYLHSDHVFQRESDYKVTVADTSFKDVPVGPSHFQKGRVEPLLCEGCLRHSQ